MQKQAQHSSSCLLLCGLLVLCILPHLCRGAFTLSLLHTANTDSQVLAVGQFNGPCTPTNATSGNDSYVAEPANLPCIGGVARRTALIKSIRASVENSLLIDGGYLFTGTHDNSQTCSVFWTLFGTEMLGQYYHEMGYDAIKIDLFEFFGGVDQLAKFIQLVPNTQVVAANLVGKNDSRLVNATIVPYAIFTFASGDKASSSPSSHYQWRVYNSFSELSGMLQAVGSMLNQGVNKIIVSVSDVSVLDSVINFVPGIDIVILPNALYANDEGVHEVVQGTYPQVKYMAWAGSEAGPQPLLVVASGNFGRRLGRLDVTFDDYGVLTSWNGESIQLDATIDADPGIQEQILAQMDEVRASSSKVVGKAAIDIEWQNSCVFGECAIGGWIADVFRNVTGTRIGLVNGGAVYGPFREGSITLGEYLVVFPFGWDFLFTFSLKGEDLIVALDNSVSLADQTNLPLSAGVGRFLSVAGLKFTWNPTLPVGQRVVDVWVEGGDGKWGILDHQQYYSITTLDFIAKGGDSYEELAASAVSPTSSQLTAATAIEAALAKSFVEPIYAKVDGRIALSNGTRMTCVAPDQRICSNNGYCKAGVCQCTAPEAAGPYCIFGAKTNSTGGSDVTGMVVGIVVPVVGVVVCVLLVALALCALLIFRVTKKKKEEWDINFDELDLDHKLGEGSFGEVYKGKWKGTEVAVKVMTPGLVTKEMKLNFHSEMRVMSALRHPNVVLFMGASSKPPRMCIIMEYMALGSLYDVLHNDLVPCIPMTLSLKIALRAAKGMHFLHSSGIVHRDLKSLNLLLDSKWNVKVSDFGLGKFKDQIKASDRHIGSIPWTAPEVLAEQPAVDYMLADIFSFGVVLFEIVTRRNPYEHLSAAAIAVGVLRDDMRPTTQVDEDQLKEVPALYLGLMRNCWDTDASLRPTFLEVMTRLESLVEDESPSTGSSPISSTTSFRPPPHASLGGARSDSSGGYGEDGQELSEIETDRPQLGAGGTKPPRGEVVIGFSDIANGDALWDWNAAAMRDATLIHNDILRDLMKKHGGYEAVLTAIGNHGEGSFCVAFQKSIDAVRWATDVQNALLKAEWPELKLTTGGDRSFSSAQLRRRSGALRAMAFCFVGLVYGWASTLDGPRSCENLSTALRNTLGGQVLVTDSLRRDLDATATDRALIKRLQPSGTLDLLQSTDQELFFELKVEGLEARFFPKTDTSYAAYGDEAKKAKEDHFTPPTSDSSPGSSTYALLDNKEVFLTSANLCRWIIDYEDLALGEQVGTGSYGLVYMAKWKGVEVAVKRFIKQKLTERLMLEFRAEVAFLSELHHPNIVLFIGACVRSPNLCIVMEFVKRGSLRTLLSDATLKLPWQQRLRMLHGASLAISYLHSLEPVILHRDLKSSNLLVDEAWNVKVADFGFARIKEENATMTRCGTPCWTAPEIIKGDNYSEKADVYSFGIVMWEVLTRKVPYADQTFMSVALEILDGKRPDVPSDCPPEFKQLMQRCWHKHQDKRPSMEEVTASLEAQIGGSHRRCGGDNV
ncbi:protein kinase domain containing protein [Acanthamoeba castellanii str. Neff]|uniref:non-specific serine/threonine protein kinase n=1 Tax=Acanthamoeba castellanii (strain ATCC 30010 / Neff) TaxID=1257118 RepID=L8GMU4_ACACF|nr:protein kinase domain containing protein [Acanthamoeba castellanii str. Neff]ELR14073.1 protein kinase domain containing protein [Acanthamoeba castellanii str. Neff]